MREGGCQWQTFFFPFFAFTAMHSLASFDACIYGLCHTVSVMNAYLTVSSDFNYTPPECCLGAPDQKTAE